ncbi:MAG: hypothetical protein JXR70_11985 [Spirochaetales bacterium]|nr:hypothetical protein [Spirochaetales bacterium]
MNALGDSLLTKKPWSSLIMGNHAVARAMLESDTKVICAYPGSPTPEIGEALESVPRNLRNFYFEYSLNEKIASEIVFGASINGHLSAVFFKSVGLNVASDAIIQMAMLEVIGGLVIVLGDDPGAFSSQNEQDNRHYSRLMYLPMFEPATPREAYEMYLKAAMVSQKYRVPVFLRLTTHVCHAYEVVSFGSLPENPLSLEARFDPQNGPYFPLVSQAMMHKTKLRDKLRHIQADDKIEKVHHFNKAEGQFNLAGKGIISAGLPALSLYETMSQANRKLDILKISLTHPLPEKEILAFLKSHEEVLVLEELDRLLEGDIKILCYDHKLSCKILAKEDEFLQGEITTGEAEKILHHCWPNHFNKPEIQAENQPTAPPRSAQMCPGCGHRSAFYAIKQALPDQDTTFTVAGIGCHLMGHFDPLNLGQVLLCMGHAPSTATGLSLFNNKRKVIAFMGDSTFFHSGLPAVANAILYDHNITLVFMDNFTTAMTGHQANPGSGELINIGDTKASKIPIQKVLESFGAKHILTTDAYNQNKLTEAVKESLEYKGFSAIIARHPCMLKFTREKQKQKALKEA